MYSYMAAQMAARDDPARPRIMWAQPVPRRWHDVEGGLSEDGFASWIQPAQSESWMIVTYAIAEDVDLDRARGVVDPDRPVLLRPIQGGHANGDVIVPA